jgi:hypothetical protein
MGWIASIWEKVNECLALFLMRTIKGNVLAKVKKD